MRSAGIFAVLLLASFATARNETGRLTVTVIDQSGAVIPRAVVRVQHWDYPPPEPPYPQDYPRQVRLTTDITAESGADGRISVELRPGTYELFISALGFEPVARSVKIGSGNETKVTSKLYVNQCNGNVTGCLSLTH
jgi:Carboxypeptidase regulatory-like domain